LISTTCHCGTVSVTIPRRPRTITNCNCSICRRYGVLWAYYQEDTVSVQAPAGATEAYSWGRNALRFVRCKTCVGVNARLFEPEQLVPVTIRLLDGAAWPAD
jgi:hypothetical protein